MVVSFLVALTGCREIEKQPHAQRLWEMHDHEADAMAARDAVARGELVAAQDAGLRLATPDPIPDLPEAAQYRLSAVRTGGSALGHARDIPSAASQLLAITAQCAGCHQVLAVAPPEPLTATGLELAWVGLLFESQARWDAGMATLGPEAPDLASAGSWETRRLAFSRWLAAPKTGNSLPARGPTP